MLHGPHILSEYSEVERHIIGRYGTSETLEFGYSSLRVLLSFSETGDQITDGALLLPRFPWNLHTSRDLVPPTRTE